MPVSLIGDGDGDAAKTRNRWTCPDDGREYAGGCLLNLSRKDSLKRHIESQRCLTDMRAIYHTSRLVKGQCGEEQEQLIGHCEGYVPSCDTSPIMT